MERSNQFENLIKKSLAENSSTEEFLIRLDASEKATLDKIFKESKRNWFLNLKVSYLIPVLVLAVVMAFSSIYAYTLSIKTSPEKDINQTIKELDSIMLDLEKNETEMDSMYVEVGEF